MQLNRNQKKLLRFVFDRFPTPTSGDGKGVRPRSSENPPAPQEIQTALRLTDQEFKLLLDFASEHQLVEKAYRYGTAEYSTVKLAPGTTVSMPVAGPAAPPDADPTDERYGFCCYQITSRGIQELNRPGPVKKFLMRYYWKCLVPIVVTIITAVILAYLGWNK